MYIVLEMVWCVIVDNKLQLFDVQTTCCNTGSDENWYNAGLEILDSRIAIDLIFAAVNRHAWVAFSHQCFQETIS